MKDIRDYDKVIISFSGGKDSMACIKACLDAGAQPHQLELHHQCVDGKDPEEYFMDWPCTYDYVKQVGAALGIPVYFQWREGGFAREMWRTEERTAPMYFEDENHEVVGPIGGVRGPLGTRRLFPQVSANLSVRWCSALI